MKILIAYATTYGSTRSIAERIHAKIDAANIGQTTIAPIDSKIAVDDFDVLIIGSCIHVGTWICPSKRFIKTHKSLLLNKPVYAFSVGMAEGKVAIEEEKTTEKWLRKQIGEGLRGHKLFGGAVKLSEMGGCFRIWLGCFGVRDGDHRDWEVVDGWADGVVGELRGEGGERRDEGGVV